LVEFSVHEEPDSVPVRRKTVRAGAEIAQKSARIAAGAKDHPKS
jgi:hypothetical protein